MKKAHSAGRHLWIVQFSGMSGTKYWVTTHLRSLTAATRAIRTFALKEGIHREVRSVKHRGTIDA